MSRLTGRPAPYAGVRAQVMHVVGRLTLLVCGWWLVGDWPPDRKAVLVCAPHTSNWDGLWMLAAAAYYRVRLRWMGKASLTRGPFGWLMTALGCVPVDRSAPQDLVRQMCEAFDASETMLLAIPPEGTRDRRPTWKSGFYHIARGAGVPIFLTVLDYGTRTIKVSGVFHPTGDYDADIVAIRAHYRDAQGLRAQKFAA